MLLYPALVFASILTTLFTLRRIVLTPASVTYVAVSALLQSLFAIPFIWRKLCLFVGKHKNAYDGIDWGQEAYYKMPLETLRRLAKKDG